MAKVFGKLPAAGGACNRYIFLACRLWWCMNWSYKRSVSWEGLQRMQWSYKLTEMDKKVCFRLDSVTSYTHFSPTADKELKKKRWHWAQVINKGQIVDFLEKFSCSSYFYWTVIDFLHEKCLSAVHHFSWDTLEQPGPCRCSQLQKVCSADGWSEGRQGSVLAPVPG